jgi:hypothetical protein
MASYEPIITDEVVKGFLVNFGYWETYWIDKGNLYISDTSVMFKVERNRKRQVWSEDGKDFSWCENKEGVKIIMIDQEVEVNALFDIPEWCNRSKEQSEIEIEEHRKELRKNSCLRKLFRMIFVGKV